MRFWSAWWALTLVASAVIVSATWGRCPGCLDRARQNDTCEWTGDTAFPIDPSNPAHQQHLVQDAQLAEDLAGRYADAEHERLYGWHGHGGLMDHGRVVRQCFARLVAVVESDHGLTVGQVHAAAAHRTPRFDAGVWLSFILLYGLGVAVACQWLDRAFAETAWSGWLAMTGLASVAVSFLGVQLGAMWTMVGEIVRLHNDHFGGHRATSPPWTQHLMALFVGGVVLFWIVALIRRSPESEADMTDNLRAPQGLVLR